MSDTNLVGASVQYFDALCNQLDAATAHTEMLERELNGMATQVAALEADVERLRGCDCPCDCKHCFRVERKRADDAEKRCRELETETKRLSHLLSSHPHAAQLLLDELRPCAEAAEQHCRELEAELAKRPPRAMATTLPEPEWDDD